MKNKKKTLITIAILIILLTGITAAYLILKNSKNDTPKENKPVSVEEIKGYDYILEDRDTTLYKEKYLDLKKLLESENIDKEKYAKLVSELYIIDLYTINNKISKYDVGSSEFVHPDYRENYELKVRDTLYKYVEDNSYNSRTQELPEVKSTNISDLKKSTYTLGEEKKDSFEASITWDYVKDLEYDKSATIILIESESKIYVVEQKTEQQKAE